MTVVVNTLASTFLECEELIAQIDEGGVLISAGGPGTCWRA